MKIFTFFTRIISNKKFLTIYLITILTFGFQNLLYSQINLTYSIGGIGNFSNMMTSTTTFSNPIMLTGTKCFIVSNGLIKFMPVSSGQFFTNCEVNLDYIKLSISVYPNPAINYTIIKFLNQLQVDDKFRVQVYSNIGDFVLGNDVTQQQLLSGYKLSLINLSAGLYYIQISSNSVLQTFKILKN
jgi:hypothetical protein